MTEIKSNNKSTWTAEELLDLKHEIYETKLTIHEISTTHGRTIGAIWAKIYTTEKIMTNLEFNNRFPEYEKALTAYRKRTKKAKDAKAERAARKAEANNVQEIFVPETSSDAGDLFAAVKKQGYNEAIQDMQEFISQAA